MFSQCIILARAPKINPDPLDLSPKLQYNDVHQICKEDALISSSAISFIPAAATSALAYRWAMHLFHVTLLSDYSNLPVYLLSEAYSLATAVLIGSIFWNIYCYLLQRLRQLQAGIQKRRPRLTNPP